jgi:hypothetical protein
MKKIIEVHIDKIRNEPSESTRESTATTKSIGQNGSKPGLLESIFGGPGGRCDCKVKYEKQMRLLNDKIKDDLETISRM